MENGLTPNQFEVNKANILAGERRQLLDTWCAVAADDWFGRPNPQVTRLSTSETAGTFNMDFRHWHNRFGWKAGDALPNRGLCSGAIYRTERFMVLDQAARNGAAANQTVHIEHTIPVSVLDHKWRLVRQANGWAATSLEGTYAWMLVHSVTTAFHTDEEAGLTGVQRANPAMDDGSPVFGKPFLRYAGHAGVRDAVWNVFTGKRVDLNGWTFNDHFDTVLGLLAEAGADTGRTAAIQREAANYLGRFAA